MVFCHFMNQAECPQYKKPEQNNKSRNILSYQYSYASRSNKEKKKKLFVTNPKHRVIERLKSTARISKIQTERQTWLSRREAF